MELNFDLSRLSRRGAQMTSNPSIIPVREELPTIRPEQYVAPQNAVSEPRADPARIEKCVVEITVFWPRPSFVEAINSQSLAVGFRMVLNSQNCAAICDRT